MNSCSQRKAHFYIGVSQCSDDEWRHQMNNEMLREALFMMVYEVEILLLKMIISNKKMIFVIS